MTGKESLFCLLVLLHPTPCSAQIRTLLDNERIFFKCREVKILISTEHNLSPLTGVNKTIFGCQKKKKSRYISVLENIEPKLNRLINFNDVTNYMRK